MDVLAAPCPEESPVGDWFTQIIGQAFEVRERQRQEQAKLQQETMRRRRDLLKDQKHRPGAA